jgi:hypothetical protein
MGYASSFEDLQKALYASSGACNWLDSWEASRRP